MKLSEVLGVLAINKIIVRVCAEETDVEYELCEAGYNPLQVMDTVHIIEQVDPIFLNRVVIDIASISPNVVMVDVY